MRYRYYTTDVFTDQTFGGNQLAVLPDAKGLDGATMQRIAREFNYSETTFVLPPDDPANTHKVRIFTPKAELPFAGHPNVGTAYVLAATGEPVAADSHTFRFEEKAGLVPVKVDFAAGKPTRAELTAPQTIQLLETMPADVLAPMLSLTEEDIAVERHVPRIASTGIPVLCVELSDLDALGRSRVVVDKMEQQLPGDKAVGFYLYTFDSASEDADIRARMYAPMHDIVEDPATGSAGCTLAGLLAHLGTTSDGTLSWRIAQGVEMGRPSLMEASAIKQGGAVTSIRIGGPAVLVCEGWIEVG